MKINLLLNSREARGGYINIDPYAPSGDRDRVVGSVTNLDAFACDAEVVDLVALAVIDFIPATDTDRVLAGWISKIRHGGSITIGGVDMRYVARSLLSQDITLAQANRLLYGAQGAPWEYRKSTLTIQHVTQLLQGQGMIVGRKSVVQYHYYVTARRP